MRKKLAGFEVHAAFGKPERDAPLVILMCPAIGRRTSGVKTFSHVGGSRVSQRPRRIPFEDRINLSLLVNLNVDFGPQLVELKTLQQGVTLRPWAIDEIAVLFFADHEEVEQDFALWGEERGIRGLIDRQSADIGGDQALQKDPGIGAVSAIKQRSGRWMTLDAMALIRTCVREKVLRKPGL